jgi:hypothetical protein
MRKTDKYVVYHYYVILLYDLFNCKHYVCNTEMDKRGFINLCPNLTQVGVFSPARSTCSQVLRTFSG